MCLRLPCLLKLQEIETQVTTLNKVSRRLPKFVNYEELKLSMRNTYVGSIVTYDAVIWQNTIVNRT